MDLASKTLTLVTLATISRASTLTIMSRALSSPFNPSEGYEEQCFVSFLPGKQEKNGRHRDGIFIALLAEDLSLDPVLFLREYIAKTGSLKPPSSADESSSSPLWVSSRKPFSKVSSVTLASWLRKAMS